MGSILHLWWPSHLPHCWILPPSPTTEMQPKGHSTSSSEESTSLSKCRSWRSPKRSRNDSETISYSQLAFVHHFLCMVVMDPKATPCVALRGLGVVVDRQAGRTSGHRTQGQLLRTWSLGQREVIAPGPPTASALFDPRSGEAAPARASTVAKDLPKPQRVKTKA